MKEDDASASPLYATLRENLFDFHLDTDFMYENLWKLKERYRDYLTEVQDQRPFIGITEFKEKYMIFFIFVYCLTVPIKMNWLK